MILFEQNHIPAETVHNQIRTKERKILLDQRRKEYFPLLSVHTLEKIGYVQYIPQVAIAITISITSNIDQIIQRIGRVIRKVQGKDRAMM